MKKIIFATNNKNKFNEINKIVSGKFELLSLNDFPITEEIPETKDTIEGNAIEKAEYIYNKFKLPCFADDSGLEINALNGEPGVYSAMYAGDQRSEQDNINLILSKLKGKRDRTAQFKTVIAYKDSSTLKTFEGTLKGRITLESKGSQGFGYDPIFIPENNNAEKTLAEMKMEEKNKISSRARAFEKFLQYLKG